MQELEQRCVKPFNHGNPYSRGRNTPRMLWKMKMIIILVEEKNLRFLWGKLSHLQKFPSFQIVCNNHLTKILLEATHFQNGVNRQI